MTPTEVTRSFQPVSVSPFLRLLKFRQFNMEISAMILLGRLLTPDEIQRVDVPSLCKHLKRRTRSFKVNTEASEGVTVMLYFLKECLGPKTDGKNAILKALLV